MHDAQVDPEARHANLRMGFPALRLQSLGNKLLERRVVISHGTAHSGAYGLRSLVRKLDEVTQIMHGPRRGTVEVDHRWIERREYHHLATSARHGNVQTAPTSFAVERPEIHGHHVGAWLGRTEPDTQDDQITLVALHGLQILDHDGFGQVVLEEWLDLSMLASRLIEKIVHQLLLFGIEGDDADGLAGCDEFRVFEPPDHLCHDGFGFNRISPSTFALRIDAIYLVPGNGARARVSCRKCNQAATVVAVIGERDKAFVPTAVMPGQTMLRHAGTNTFLKNALQILVGIVLTSARATVEEAGRRHLPWITGDDHLLTTGDGAYGIPGSDL